MNFTTVKSHKTETLFLKCSFVIICCHTSCWFNYVYQDLSMEDLESKCYDKFDFKLEDLQVLIAKTGKSYFVRVDVQIFLRVSVPHFKNILDEDFHRV